MGGGVDRKPGRSSLVHDRLSPGLGLGVGKRTLTEQLEPVQRRASSPAPTTADVQTAAAHGTSGPADTLPHLDSIQRAFGRHDVSHVKAHTDTAARDGAGAMGAQAFATGDHVAFAGSPDLHTVAHEAAHVVQQRGGVQLKGGVGEVGDDYEQHADQVADQVVAGRSAEQLLDQHAGSGDATRAVQRREQNGPYTGNRPDRAKTGEPGYKPVNVPDTVSPAPLATMRDFIALVRRVEAAYGNLPWQDVVTRIRKEYYPGPRGGIDRGLMTSVTWDDLIDEREDSPGLAVPPVAMADVAAIRHRKVVTTDSGESIDIGHVLTGVDSFNFPGVAGSFARHDMEGPAAATWSGDVGSALAGWANDAPLDDASAATKLKFYDRLASRSDMLGDVDALAIAHGPNINLPAGAPLSQRLEAFYQAAPASGPAQRFHSFCRASHFNLASNQLDALAVARIREQILRFARGYNVKGAVTSAMILGGSSGVGAAAAIESTSMARVESGVGWFADHFASWVNAGLAAEGGH